MNSSATKWTMGHIMAWLLAIVLLIGVSIFLSMVLMQHFQSPAQLLAAATNLFTLFGILLAVGVAFALFAVCLSFLSLNEKLRQSQSYLAQSRLHLDEYKQLARQEEQIQHQVYDLIKYYDNIADSIHTHEINHIHTQVKQILSSPFADFEARLIARAVQQDLQTTLDMQIAETENTLTTWEKALQNLQQTATQWQTLLSASPEFLHLGQKARFLTAQLNQAFVLRNMGNLNGRIGTLEYYREIHALLHPFLFVEKSKNEQINQLIYDANHHCSVLLYREGEAWLKQGTHHLDDVRQKWQEAQRALQKALEIQNNNIHNWQDWGHFLEREARLIMQSDATLLPEARQLWQKAREKYQKVLDIDRKQAQAAFYLGNTLSDEAIALIQTDETQLHEARALWQQARDKFKLALGLDSAFADAAHNMGLVFMREADAILNLEQSYDEARALWKAAGEQYHLALNIAPNRCDSANSWGLALAKEADLLAQLDDEQIPEAQRLWELAQQCFQRALEIEPTLQAAVNNWRTVLSHQMEVLDDKTQLAVLHTVRDNLLTLQHISSAHSQSQIIVEFADFVNQTYDKLIDEVPAESAALQPPTLSPMMRG